MEVWLLTERELRKLNRYQLLELLITQTERADQLQAQVEQLEKKLKERDLKMDSMGSIAEASLQIGGVFQAEQAAAELYLSAAKRNGEEIEAEAQRKAALILEDAEYQARKRNEEKLEEIIYETMQWETE
jgi:cell division septum initiation protein DivIVA